MTLRHFRIFVTVCDTMNMTRAAERMYISQSAVSQAISELEANYDTKLFDRLSKKIYLTQAGEKLLSYARHIIKMTEDAQKDIKTIADNGLLRIGASVTVGTYILPALVSEFKNINPKSKIQVIENNTAAIEHLILKDEIDIAIVEGDVNSPEIAIEQYFEDELVFISGKEHRFFGKPIINLEDLEDEDFIIREQGSGTRKLLESIMNSAHINLNIAWECSNFDTIKIAVINGFGISLVSNRIIKSENEQNIISQSKINNMPIKRHFKIIYHKNKYFTKQMLEFKEFCNPPENPHKIKNKS